MKILFATLAFDPRHVSPYPGVNRYSLELARALALAGVGVTVVTPLRAELPENEIWHGIEICRLADSKTYAGRLGVIAEGNFVTFALNLRRHPSLYADTDVLYTNIPMYPVEGSWAPMPIVFFLHHVLRFWQVSDLLTVPFGFYYEHMTLKAAHTAVVPSVATRNDVLRQHHLPADKVVVVHHGVNKELFKPSDARTPGQSGNEIWLMYAGLLDSRKGIRELIPIFVRLHKRNPQIRLLIVGTGLQEDNVKKRLVRHGIQKSVRIVRDLTDGELVNCLNSADIFLFPSRLEGFGLAAVEAMACGKPVVAFSNPFTSEIIGEGGMLIPDGDLDRFAASVEMLLRNPSRAAEIGLAGRRRVEREFDWKLSARAHIEVFERALRDGGR